MEPDKNSSNLSERILNSIDNLGSPDDYAQTTIKPVKAYRDGEIILNMDELDMFKSRLAVVHEGLPPAMHSFGDQIAMILNTELFQNSFGEAETAFYGEIVQQGLKKPSELWMRYKDGNEMKTVKLFSFSEGFSEPRDDGSNMFNFTTIIQAREGLDAIDDTTANAIRKFMTEFTHRGFPVLDQLYDESGKRFKNPISPEGRIEPKKEFFAADLEAMKLRDQLTKLTVLLKYNFDNRNRDITVSSRIDQIAAEIYDLILQRGIDLNEYKDPPYHEIHKPINTATRIAYDLLDGLFTITDSPNNYMDAIEDTNPITTEGERLGDEIGVNPKNLRQEQVDGIVAEHMLNYGFIRLDISKEERKSILDEYGLEHE